MVLCGFLEGLKCLQVHVFHREPFLTDAVLDNILHHFFEFRLRNAETRIILLSIVFILAIDCDDLAENKA